MMPRLRFHGAAQGVTGSCYLLETERARILIDCGLFQVQTEGTRYRDFPFGRTSIRPSFLHARISTGGLSRSSRRLRWSDLRHPATVDLCSVMLPTRAIQEMEVEQLNRRNARQGRAAVEAIYTAEDATACLTSFRPVAYEEWTIVAPGLRASSGTPTFSAPLRSRWRLRRLVPMGRCACSFRETSGPTTSSSSSIRAPQGFDYVICKSTYGDTDRDDASPGRRLALLREEVLSAAKPRRLLIPSFAVERTQELLVDLIGLMQAGRFLPPVFIDSPLATKASAIFANRAGRSRTGKRSSGPLGARRSGYRNRRAGRRSTDHKLHQSVAERDVRGRPHPPPPQGMAVARRGDGASRRLPGAGDAQTNPAGRRAARAAHGRGVRVRAPIRSLDLYSGMPTGRNCRLG